MLIGNSLFIENNIDFLFFLMYNFYLLARVAKLADALDLGSSGRPCRFKSCWMQRCGADHADRASRRPEIRIFPFGKIRIFALRIRQTASGFRKAEGNPGRRREQESKILTGDPPSITMSG